MYFRQNDQKPKTQMGSGVNPVYATATIGKKMHDIRVFRKVQGFDQTEVALLVHVTHQRISAWVKYACAKAVREMQAHPEHLELLFYHLKEVAGITLCLEGQTCAGRSAAPCPCPSRPC